VCFFWVLALFFLKSFFCFPLVSVPLTFLCFPFFFLVVFVAKVFSAIVAVFSVFWLFFLESRVFVFGFC